jgi:hypothetical protein
MKVSVEMPPVSGCAWQSHVSGAVLLNRFIIASQWAPTWKPNGQSQSIVRSQ